MEDYIYFTLIFFILLTVFLIERKIFYTLERLSYQEKTIDKLCSDTGCLSLGNYFIPESLRYDLSHLKQSGFRMRAVRKLVRNSGISFEDAKDYIDKI